MGGKRAYRKKQEQERNRLEVIEATVNLFYEKGYKGVTVPEIAKAVEFGVGTLYRLFPGGKEEIYHAMQELVVLAFEEQIQSSMAGAKDEIDIIRRYIRAAAAMYETYPKQMSMYLRDTAGVGLDLGCGLAGSLSARYRACARHVESAMESAQKKGRLKPMPAGAPLMCLRSIINGFLINRQENKSDATMEDYVELIEDFFLNGLNTK